MRGRLFFTWTQRPLLKIIMSVKQKLFRRLATDLGPEFEKDIAQALNDEDIVDNIKEMVEKEQIELIGEDCGQPLLKKQLTALQEAQEQQDGTGGDVLNDSVNIRLESPSAT